MDISGINLIDFKETGFNQIGFREMDFKEKTLMDIKK